MRCQFASDHPIVVHRLLELCELIFGGAKLFLIRRFILPPPVGKQFQCGRIQRAGWYVLFHGLRALLFPMISITLAGRW